MTQATADRIRQIFDDHGEYYAATEQIAAELDAKDAEIARLKPAAEAWEEMEHMFHSGPASLELSYSYAKSRKEFPERKRAVQW